MVRDSRTLSHLVTGCAGYESSALANLIDAIATVTLKPE